jgi:hypothetical protein
MKSILRARVFFLLSLFGTASDWPGKSGDQDTVVGMNLNFLRGGSSSEC